MSYVNRVLRKLKRLTAKVTGRPLPDEEGAFDAKRLEKLWHWVNGMQQTVNTLYSKVDSEAIGSNEHVDLVVDQLWRRLESADARLATRLDKLEALYGQKFEDVSNVTGRIRVENSAILRLIGHEDKIAEAKNDNLPIPEMTLFSEVERGSTDCLTSQLEKYVPYFEKARLPILDFGCGKGDFLALLQQAKINSYGIDLDNECVILAKERGLDARLAEIIEHLKQQDDNSLGGVFSSQVVEHLPAEMIVPLYEEMFRAVKPGGFVIMETPNPSTFVTHTQSFWRDPTHTRPVPHTSLDFAARRAGFLSQQIVYSAPTADDDKLIKTEIDQADPVLAEFGNIFNQNMDRLNHVLFGWQNYAHVAQKPE